MMHPELARRLKHLNRAIEDVGQTYECLSQEAKQACAKAGFGHDTMKLLSTIKYKQFMPRLEGTSEALTDISIRLVDRLKRPDLLVWLFLMFKAWLARLKIRY